MNVKDKNRWTAAVAAASCLVLIVAIAVLSSKPISDRLLQRPSTFFTDSSGARAIYLVLQRVLTSAEQWRFPITELQQPSRAGVATLIVMGPNSLGQAEAKALDAWILSGGQLILAAGGDWSIQKSSTDRSSKDFLAQHGIPTRSATYDRTWSSAIDGAITRNVGRGRIIYVPESRAFSNGTLRTTDNAVWLVDRCLEWGGGALFDEYHLGFGAQRGLASLLIAFAITPWGLVSMQLALAGVVYILSCKRRFGKPLEELPVERTNPIETVQAVAGLFKSARAGAMCAKTIHQYLNAHVSSIVGYRIDFLDAQARERLAGPLRIDRQELDSYAEAAKAAISTHFISDAELIRFEQQATAIARSFTHGTTRGRHSAAAG